MHIRAWLGLGALLGVAATPAAGLEIGERAGFFSAKDIRYLPRTLHDFPEPKAFVLAFTGFNDDSGRECLDILRALDAAHAGDGVYCIALNVDPETSIRRMAWHAVTGEYRFPVLNDTTGAAARALGMERYPAVAVLDGERTLRFRGAPEQAPAALDALLNGTPMPETAPIAGKAITPREIPAPERPVTYAEHIAPILARHCAECHRPGEAAPFAFRGYEDAAAHAAMISEVVLEERMPPWYALDGVGNFFNKPGLREQDKLLIAQWVAGGKQPGDLDAAPPMSGPREDTWRMDPPDLVLTAEKVEEIPAEGYVPYRYIALPYQFPHDTWVQGMEILPANPSVVHHANLVYALPKPGETGPDGEPKLDYDGANNFLIGMAPGSQPLRLIAGIGMKIPEGAVLILQVHYVTTGKPETDQISVGIRFARERIRQQVHFTIIRNNTFAIPPGDPLHRVHAEQTIGTDVTGLALFGHMHLRGRSFHFVAHYPDGREELLLAAPNFSFDWQIAYQWFPGMKQFPKGTRIEAIAHFDNSPFNAYNPDPESTVTWGPQTHEEMWDGYFFYLDNNERLNLDIDPGTGQAIEQVARKD